MSSQLSTKPKKANPNSGPKQTTDVVNAAKGNVLAFAGYMFMSALGTQILAAFNCAMQIVRYRNYQLLLLAIVSTHVPRGIIIISSADELFIRAQGHKTLIVEGRQNMPDTVNYTALRMVGYIFCMIGVDHEMIKAYLNANGNPLGVQELKAPTENDTETFKINHELQASFPMSDRVDLAAKLSALTPAVKAVVIGAANAGPALHAHFLELIAGTTKDMALMDKNQKVFLVDQVEGAKRLEYNQVGVFSAQDFADDAKHVKTTTSIKMKVNAVVDADGDLGAKGATVRYFA